MIHSKILSHQKSLLHFLRNFHILRPYTRDQRNIKLVKKREENIYRKKLSKINTPIILQSTFPSLHDSSIETSSFETNINQIDYDKKQLKSISTNLECSGCGARFQNSNAGAPGFVSQDEILKLQNSEIQARRRLTHVPILPKLCYRCKLIEHHSTLFKSHLLPGKLENMVASEINRQPSAILVVADCTNLPHSIAPLRLSNPSEHRFILVGNKVDQLPIDGEKFYTRWREALLKAYLEVSKMDEQQIAHVSLISALNGYGMNRLLDFLLSAKFNSIQSPVYIVGSTNVGKSSLFNRLLMSDFCKSEARESIHRATISKWPGTTVGILKFPITRVSSVKHGLRAEARFLYKHSDQQTPKFTEMHGYRILEAENPGESIAKSDINLKVARTRVNLQDLSKLPTYKRTPEGEIEESKMNLQTMFKTQLKTSTKLEDYPDSKNRLLIGGTLDPRLYNPRAWCYDTPGLESSAQVLNQLSPEQFADFIDLTSSCSKNLHHPEQRFILPRTFILRPGLSLLLGRLGRIDLTSAVGPVYLTTHSRLPIHIVDTTLVEEYVNNFATFLGPGGNYTDKKESHSISSLSKMTEFKLKPLQPSQLDFAIADVVLSDAGWVSVAGGFKHKHNENLDKFMATNNRIDEDIYLVAWTPGAAGISLRLPALIPTAIRRRGSRLLFLREFAGSQGEAKRFENASVKPTKS